MNLFELAKLEVCHLCKGEDVDEVEAVILLLMALLEDVWVEQMVNAKDEVVSFLDSFVDNKPTTELDVFSSIAPGDTVSRTLLLGRLKDHVLALIQRRADAALDLASERVVRDAGEELLLAGALAAGASLDFAAGPTDALLRPAAVEDLRVLLRGHSAIREDQIRNLVDEYVKTPALRAPRAPVIPGTSASTLRDLWNTKMETAIGVETAAWLPVTIDLWAYRWFTIGRYRALRQRSGPGIIVAQATIDHKTTPFCLWVDGRRIDIAFADKQLSRHLDAVMAGDVDAMMANWPLVNPRQTGDAREPIGLPPYHARCRTIPRYIMSVS